MFKNTYVDGSTKCTHCSAVLNFMVNCDSSMAQKAVRQFIATQSMLSNAAVACIKDSNSIEECIRFATINPTAYTILMAKARINVLSSLRGKSTIIGGHEKDE